MCLEKRSFRAREEHYYGLRSQLKGVTDQTRNKHQVTPRRFTLLVKKVGVVALVRKYSAKLNNSNSLALKKPKIK